MECCDGILELTFLLATLAGLGWLGWTIRSTMADLFADTTSAAELAFDAWVGTVGLVVSEC